MAMEICVKRLLTLQERIKRVQDEIRGVRYQSDVTQWEIDFMAELQARDIAFGSDKQKAVLERIEQKVFGAKE